MLFTQYKKTSSLELTNLKDKIYNKLKSIVLKIDYEIELNEIFN